LGSELVSDSSPREGGESGGSAALSYTEVFYKHLPYYLAIGMPNDLYWNGDCRLTESYRQAEEIRQRQKNQEMWLQGMYIYEALCDVSPILQAFAKKGTKPVPYSSEPYAITQKQVEEKRARDEQLRYEKTKAKMAAWAANTNTQIAIRAGKEINGG
jgi:hypothetical protein